MKYEVTKKFVSGVLKGITIKEVTSVFFPVGFVAKRGPYTPSGYVVIARKPI